MGRRSTGRTTQIASFVCLAQTGLRMSDTEFAAWLGVQEALVRQWRRGQQRPNVVQLRRLCRRVKNAR